MKLKNLFKASLCKKKKDFSFIFMWIFIQNAEKKYYLVECYTCLKFYTCRPTVFL